MKTSKITIILENVTVWGIFCNFLLFVRVAGWEAAEYWHISHPHPKRPHFLKPGFSPPRDSCRVRGPVRWGGWSLGLIRKSPIVFCLLYATIGLWGNVCWKLKFCDATLKCLFIIDNSENCVLSQEIVNPKKLLVRVLNVSCYKIVNIFRQNTNYYFCHQINNQSSPPVLIL